MFRRNSSIGYITCVAAAAVVAGAVGYSMMTGRNNVRHIKRRATKTIGRISDRMIDNINAMM